MVLFCLLAAIGLLSQLDTNAPSNSTSADLSRTLESTQMVSGDQRIPISRNDLEYLKSQGLEPVTGYYENTNDVQTRQPSLPPTSPDLKSAFIRMDSFLGMTNVDIVADVISMKVETLKFRLNGQDFEYSGHYTVVLSKVRLHKNPYFGFGSPDKAKIVNLEDFGGDGAPLPDGIIWEKSNGFIDVESMQKEWIYSGPYTIQSQ
jgi:hypothetical protein